MSGFNKRTINYILNNSTLFETGMETSRVLPATMQASSKLYYTG